MKGGGMKSRSEIWLSALEDLGALCSVDTTRDGLTVTRRFEREGDAFFTKTLPAMAKDLERSLAIGQLPRGLFVGWQRKALNVRIQIPGASGKTKQHSSAGTPNFLGGFFDLVFDSAPVVLDEIYYRLEDLQADFGAPMRTSANDDDTARMASAIYAIRQLCLLFSKEEDLCSDALVDAAIERYVAHDGTLDDPFRMNGESSSSSWVTWIPFAGS